MTEPLPTSDAATPAAGQSLTRRARKRLKLKARKQLGKLERRLDAAIAAGQTQRAHGLKKLMLNARSAKLVSLVEANQRPHRGEQRAPSERLAELSQTMSLYRECHEPVKVWPKRKGLNDFRPIHEFRLERRAMQKLAARVAKPFIDLDPRQYLLRGGRNAAIQAVLDHIRSGGCKVAMEIDIKSFYPSVDHDWLRQQFPLGRRVTETVITDRETTRYYHGNSHVSVIALMTQSLRGLMQGSVTSSLAGEFVIAHILKRLPPGVIAVVYADNILLLARSSREMLRAFRTLLRAFEPRPGGLPLAIKPWVQISRGFDFLGYRIRTVRGEPYVTADDDNKRKLTDRIAREVRSMFHYRHDGSRLEQYVLAWQASFDLWEGRGHFCWGLLYGFAKKVPEIEDAIMFAAREHLNEVRARVAAYH